MGRIRTIKPEFFTDEDIADLPPITRLLFIGLWTLADKSGRLKDTPRTIKARILPFEGKIDIDACMNQLVEGSFIIRYSVEGCGYIQVRTWDEHQRPHHTEPPSGIPRCDNGCATVSSTCLREGKGREGKGKEGKGKEGSPRPTSVVNPEDLILPEGIDTEEVRTALMNWISYKRDRGDTYQPRGLSALVNKLAKMQTPKRVCDAIENSMANTYAGIFEPRISSNGQSHQKLLPIPRPELPFIVKRFADMTTEEFDQVKLLDIPIGRDSEYFAEDNKRHPENRSETF